jgi:DNA primase
MNANDTIEIRRLSIKNVAARLGIKVLRGNKAMCFYGHDKKTPSLSFHVKKNFWKCFGCNRGGDAIELAMLVLNCDFRSALNWFETEFGISVSKGQLGSHSGVIRPIANRRVTPPQRGVEVGTPDEFASDPTLYSWILSKCGPVSQPLGLSYLTSHGISLSLATNFGVRELRNPERALHSVVKEWGAARVIRSGLAWERHGQATRLIWSSYALLFPFYENQMPIYLQGRLFDGRKKYLNPKGIAKPLYNADRLRSLSAGKRIHICEGVPDALALEENGLPAVAVLGAGSFREQWVDAFMPYEIALMPDGDSGGRAFCQQIRKLFRARGKSTLIVSLPEGKDVAEVAGHIDSKRRPA